MKTIVLSNKRYLITKIISNRYPFKVYLTIDDHGKEVIAKTTFENEKTISTNSNSFCTYSSRDTNTSAYYGHYKADLSKVNIEILLELHVNYLINCAYEYNIANCFLERDINGKHFLFYDFISGVTLNGEFHALDNLFIKMIPSLLRAVSNCPHGDLSFNNLILHSSGNKFSIIDPSIIYEGLFFTNTEFYPIVPPLFHKPPKGYLTYPDQLAIGIMLYKCLTGTNAFDEFRSKPFWQREFGYEEAFECRKDEIYPFYTSSLGWTREFLGFDENNYIEAIKLQLKEGYCSNNDLLESYYYRDVLYDNLKRNRFPKSFYHLISPFEKANTTKQISDLCMNLIYTYQPFDIYIEQIQHFVATV